jgi:type VII secretion integral membrane protein EccD
VPAPSTGLTRVTISSPQRRVDVALPNGTPLAELLPELLAQVGESLADEGERHGGWLLRRADGTALTATSGLAAAGIRDGEVLRFTPAHAEWPEPEYDDVVEAIAAAARRYGLGWSPRATRVAGLAAASVGLLLALAALLRVPDPQWTMVGPVALGVAALLVLAGTLASRAYGEALLGSTLAAHALPYAAAGGLVLLLEPSRSLIALGPPHLLVAGTALALLSVVAAIGVARGLRVFVAGMTVGLLTVLTALVAEASSATSAAAVVITVLVTGVAAVPLLAIRLGKLPMPVPGISDADPTAADSASDDPSGGRSNLPPASDRIRVVAAVARADEILTGILSGYAVLAIAATVVLVRDGGLSARLLAAVAATAFLLRARLFATVRQRVPLLAAGVLGYALLGAAWLGLSGGVGLSAAVGLGAAGWGRPVGSGGLWLALAVGLAALSVLVAAAAARYAAAAPSPYFGRAADLVDGLCVVSVVPIACAVLGVYSRVRGLAG